MEHTLSKSCHPHAFAHFDVGRSMFDVGRSQKQDTRKNVYVHRKECKGMERAKGFEPSTATLARWSSTTELRSQSAKKTGRIIAG